MKSYCVKEKKQTDCVEPSGYKTAKNGRLMFWCTCASCGIKKTRFVSKQKKLINPPLDGGSLATLGKMAGKAGKKAAEMTRFFVSEWLREPGSQQMLVNKANPFLKKRIDQVLTAIRPKLKYKTNRKDLDGAGIFDLVYGPNYAPWTSFPQKGKGLDIHKAIGKLPKPKGGFTLPGHKYTGPYNPLDEQLRYDPQTGEILEFYVKPTGKTDAVAAQHDVDYSVCEGKENPKKCKKKRRSQDGESFGFYSPE